MPPQKLADSEKTEEWGKRCVDAISNMSNYTIGGRTSRYKKQVNYDLYVSRFNEDDIKYVVDPYGISKDYGKSPARMQMYNKIREDIQALRGEEIKRPFKWGVISTAGEALNVRKQKRIERIQQSLQQRLQALLGAPEVDEQGQPIVPESLKKIDQYFRTQYSDPGEVQANLILKHLIQKEKLETKFNQGFEHALICAEEIYYVGIVNGDVKVRVVNPLNFDFDKDPDLKYVQDGQWAKEERWMTQGSVLDEFGEYLTEDDVRRIDEYELGNYTGMREGYVYPMEYMNQMPNHSNNSGHIVVNTVTWKTMKKIGILTYFNEFGKQNTIVDGDYKLSAAEKAQGWEIEYRWINEVWQGTKIGGDIYVNIGPLPNQCRSLDNPSECKLPYVGFVYNAINSEATSLIDLLKPHQYLYNIVWYRLELELAKAKGKKAMIDIAQIPRSMGIDVEKWLYYFDNVGVAFINSLEENPDTHKTSAFNAYKEFDLTLSQSIGQYILILNKLEQTMSSLSGVSTQRKGETSASETATGVQAAVVNSTNTTEPFFYEHNEVKEAVLTQALECCKLAYINGKTISMVVDDIYKELIEIDGALINSSDHGLFVTNGSKEAQYKEDLKGLAQIALQTDKARLSDIIKIYKSNSISEIESTIVKFEEETIQRQEQNAEADRQNQIQMSETQAQVEREKMEFERTENQLDRQNKLTIAQITSIGMDQTPDDDGNGVMDVLELTKIQQKSAETSQKMQLERDKLVANQINDSGRMEHEREMQDKELAQRDKDNQTKIQIVKMKPKPKPAAKKK